MRIIVGLGSLVLILLVLVDTFEAVLLPRRVTHGYRWIRFFYRHSWRAWRRIVGLIRSPKRRESGLSLFGPLALIVLFATWAAGLVIAFGALHWALQTPMSVAGTAGKDIPYFYFSGVTFFTLGYGDVVPAGTIGRFLAVVETGLGFGFLAMVISYHPVLTQAFSHREIVISLLDARGGSPPTATQILIRSHQNAMKTTLANDLASWEVWSAELLESHLSFPMLAYYRSQHDNQSWIAALTAILDTCAMEIAGISQCAPHQARMTFAIARHAAVDLTLVFKIRPIPPEANRLGQESVDRLQQQLSDAGIQFPNAPERIAKLTELRKMYEPFVNGLSEYFLMRLPEFIAQKTTADNWQTSAWMAHTPGIVELKNLEPGDHF